MITQELDFYSHVNYSVTKIEPELLNGFTAFYSHVNYSVTKISSISFAISKTFTVT